MQHYTQLSPQCLFVYMVQTDCSALWQNDSDSQLYLYTMGYHLKNSSLIVWIPFAFSFMFCSGELILHYCDNDNEDMDCKDCTRAVNGFISRLRLFICAGGEKEDKVCHLQCALCK